VSAVLVIAVSLVFLRRRVDPHRRVVATPTSRSTSTTSTTAPARVTSTTRPVPKVVRASPLGQAFATYVGTREGRITVAAYDTASRQTWLYRPHDAQATASVVKVDIMAALLEQATETSATLSQSQASELQRMIELSDNDAATSLWNTVGGTEGLRAFNSHVGLVETTPSTCVECPDFPWPGWGLTTTTAGDQIQLLKTIAFPNAILTNASRLTALDLMDNITPSERWGVTGGVPADVPVALKNGWLPLSNGDWQINSVGWIRGQGRNYLLAILTTGNPSENYGIETTNEISSLVWQALAPDAAPS
jgi:beta-lactamase class A